MNLVIVESPSKARTIKKFLGANYTVEASLGHVKDLPTKTLGVNLSRDFSPYYQIIPNKRKVVETLRKAAEKANSVFIATDPDREGEAIAAHVAEIIQKSHPHPRRVLFHEITHSAVQQAIAKPSEIDLRKVDAQIARRVVDRLVGYQVSPFIWRTVAKGLSAGRVQSVALRLICEREQEIRDFTPQESWSVHALFSGQNLAPFWTELVGWAGKKVDLPDEAAANAILGQLKSADYQVSALKRSVLQSAPPAPYITSTLQQDAARRLRLSPKKTMSLAQVLYEGVELPSGERTGLITYMRTDSTRIAAEATQAAKRYIEDGFGAVYLPEKTRIYKQKGRTQDAHEAIRPTDVFRTPETLKGVLEAPLWKLYELIWSRFVASQMANAKFDVTVIEVDGGKARFRARGQKRTFDGWQRIYNPDGDKESELPLLPSGFGVGFPLSLEASEGKQHFTQPPPWYTEATLIKALDELGIGRPSTYATIVSTLYDRKYVESKERKLSPTQLGETVNKILVSLFPDLFEVSFTARMEEQLDQVEEGASWVQIVRDFYEPFAQSLEEANRRRQDVKAEVQIESDVVCEKCGSPMIIKWSRKGQFLACSAFPKCRNARPLTEPETVEQHCPQCGAQLAIKSGRYGRFLGCLNYPKCKYVAPLTTGVKCPLPDCGGELVERTSPKGRFYSCSRYPNCKYRVSRRPVSVACPECGFPLMLQAGKAEDDGQLVCPKCKAMINPVPAAESVAA